MTLRLALALALPVALLALPGCDDSPGPATPGVRVGAAPADKPAPAPAAKPAEEVKPREILNKRTTDIRDAQKEMKTGGAREAGPRPIAKDPITLSGNVYVSAIGQTAIGQIKHSMDLYHANNDGKYPETYQEFMDKIIKENGIALPTLPYYQEYGYDAKEHKLIILEYPDKKAAVDARRP
jgi:hypothetical protein